MTFLWPSMLILLLLAPVVVFIYLRLQRQRRARVAGLFGQRSPAASARTAGFRRHLPPLLLLISLVVILLALARPHAQISLPRIEGVVMLVLDISASMSATDAEPSRLEAAKAVAREFILSQPPTVKVGIVSFSSSGFLVQAPTNDAASLLQTIDRLEPTSGTSLGQGILSALNTIALDAGLAPVVTETPGPGSDLSADPGADPSADLGAAASGLPPDALLAQLPEGPYPASAIAILSDGENNQSVDPFEAAQAAADRAVRIDALGFGTTTGATIEIDGFSVHTALDEAALEQIAATGGGAYYPMSGEQDLPAVFASLTPQLVVKPEAMEITAVFAGASILLLLAGSLLSLVWFNRLL